MSGNDRWFRLPIGGVANLENVGTLKCINVAGASMSNGARLIRWPCGHDTNSGWHPGLRAGRQHLGLVVAA
jgi:hypothetical protein